MIPHLASTAAALVSLRGQAPSLFASDPCGTASFNLHNADLQFVTIVVVPGYSRAEFHVSVTDSCGNKIASSDSHSIEDVFFMPHGLINFVHMLADAGDYRVHVTAAGGMAAPDYRLLVVGSTAAFQTSDISGPHQVHIPSPCNSAEAPEESVVTLEPEVVVDKKEDQ